MFAAGSGSRFGSSKMEARQPLGEVVYCSRRRFRLLLTAAANVTSAGKPEGGGAAAEGARPSPFLHAGSGSSPSGLWPGEAPICLELPGNPRLPLQVAAGLGRRQPRCSQAPAPPAASPGMAAARAVIAFWSPALRC